MKNHAIFILAKNVFDDARHSRVLYIAFGFAVALILFSYFLGQISLNQNIKVVKDLGMATISLMGIFVAVYLSVNTLFQEVKHRTIYTVISKPLRRYEVVLGKFLGMAWVLLAVVALMSLILYFVIGIQEFTFDYQLLPALFLIYLEMLIIAAFGLVFSSFSSPFLSGFFTFGIFLIGRVSYALGQFGERSKSAVFKFFATGIQKVFDLAAFDLRGEVVHGLPIYREDILYPLAYAAALILVCMVISAMAFERRDFK